MKSEEAQRIDLTAEDVAELLAHAKAGLGEKHYQLLEKLVDTFVYLSRRLESEGVTVRELRKLLFGLKSEKLSKVFANQEEKTPNPVPPDPGGKLEGAGKGDEGGASASEKEGTPPGDEKPAAGEGEAVKERKGHGRNPASAYQGAEKIEVQIEDLEPGARCPDEGCEGRVYELPQPKVLVRIVGRAPLGATVIELQQLRCNLCLKVFTAKVPEGLDGEKYDQTAGSMIALLRYGTGVPFNRLEGLQGNFGIPLPASTQWDVVERAYKKIRPAYEELSREAAQGDVLHNDDTPMNDPGGHEGKQEEEGERGRWLRTGGRTRKHGEKGSGSRRRCPRSAGGSPRRGSCRRRRGGRLRSSSPAASTLGRTWPTC